VGEKLGVHSNLLKVISSESCTEVSESLVSLLSYGGEREATAILLTEEIRRARGVNFGRANRRTRVFISGYAKKGVKAVLGRRSTRPVLKV